MSYIPEAIKTGVKAGLINAMSAMPGIIQSFDPKDQTVKVQLAIMRIVDGKDEPYTLLVDVPILLPTVQGFHLTMPIQPQDECLVMFADRCVDGWFAAGGVQPQQTHRVHHISDGFALVGVNSKPNAITDYSTDSMVIRNTKNSQKITLKLSGDIEIETDKNINVTCAEAVIKASAAVKIDTPATTITGSLQVDGPITSTKAISSAVSISAPSVIAATGLTVAEVPMEDHVHGGVTPGTGQTAPVV